MLWPYNSVCVIFKYDLVIDVLNISSEGTLKWMPWDFVD